MDLLRAFRLTSLAEATSFLLLLLVAMPVKYLGGNEVLVQLVGPIHGVLFIAYVGFVLVSFRRLAWSWSRTILALIASVLPVAPLYVERHWIKEPVAA